MAQGGVDVSFGGSVGADQPVQRLQWPVELMRQHADKERRVRYLAFQLADLGFQSLPHLPQSSVATQYQQPQWNHVQ